MYSVKIEWISAENGGRKAAPPKGKYYSVARFPEDIIWQNNAWSVVFVLEKQIVDNGKEISFGTVDFLVETAPKERMEKNSQFEIYEGPKKVADVYLINN